MDVPSDPKEEIDFRDLLRQPLRLFGYSTFLFLLVLTTLGIYFLKTINTVGRNDVPIVAPMDSARFVQDIPFKAGEKIPPVDLAAVSQPTPELLARGSVVFHQLCSSCHGETGLGDGPTAATLTPKPRNFHSLDGWKNGSKISSVYKTLQEGIAGSGMASFSYVPPADRFALIHTVRSFAQGQPLDSPQELQALESTYQLSKGSEVAPQIPIQKAALILSGSAASQRGRIDTLVDAVSSSGEPGAVVMRATAVDLRRTLTCLVLHGQFTSSDQFIKGVSADPRQYGFAPRVNGLSMQDWRLMYEYLSSVGLPAGEKSSIAR